MSKKPFRFLVSDFSKNGSVRVECKECKSVFEVGIDRLSQLDATNVMQVVCLGCHKPFLVGTVLYESLRAFAVALKKLEQAGLSFIVPLDRCGLDMRITVADDDAR